MKSVYKIRLKKGDMVKVRSGSFKGRTGKILAVHPADNKVTVEGIQVTKKYIKPTQQRPQGRTLEFTRPILVSKVGLLDATTKKASRIGYSVAKDGSKVRVAKASGKEVK